MCQAFYHILRSSKTRFTQGRLFYTQGPLCCALGPLFCALLREEAIFVVCKRCANEGSACMCKEKTHFISAARSGTERRSVTVTPSLSGEKEHIVPKMFLRKKTSVLRNISRVNIFGVAESNSEVGFSKFKIAHPIWQT